MNTQSTVPATFEEYLSLHPYQYSVSYTEQDHYTDMWDKWEKLITGHESKEEAVSVSVEEAANNEFNLTEQEAAANEYIKAYEKLDQKTKSLLYYAFKNGANWQKEEDKKVLDWVTVFDLQGLAQNKLESDAIIGELLDIIKDYDKDLNGLSAQNRLNENGLALHSRIKSTITKATNHLNK